MEGPWFYLLGMGQETPGDLYLPTMPLQNQLVRWHRLPSCAGPFPLALEAVIPDCVQPAGQSPLCLGDLLRVVVY